MANSAHEFLAELLALLGVHPWANGWGHLLAPFAAGKAFI